MLNDCLLKPSALAIKSEKNLNIGKVSLVSNGEEQILIEDVSEMLSGTSRKNFISVPLVPMDLNFDTWLEYEQLTIKSCEPKFILI